MIEFVKLHHVSLVIKDLETSKRFYSDVLGLRQLPRPGFKFPGAWYALGDRQLHLIQEPSPEKELGGRISRSDHMALEVKDTEAVKQKLTEAGIEYGEGGNRALGMDQVFCCDPDGHVIEFVRYYDD